jgi:hypothetical protein
VRAAPSSQPGGRTSGRASVGSQARDAVSRTPLPLSNRQVNPLRPVLEPHRAGAITGIRPACDTRCGSSNVAWIFASSCNNRTCEVSSPQGSWKCQQLPSSPAQRAPFASPRLNGHLLNGGLTLRSGCPVFAWSAFGHHRIVSRSAERYIHISKHSIPPLARMERLALERTASEPTAGWLTISSASRYRHSH